MSQFAPRRQPIKVKEPKTGRKTNSTAQPTQLDYDRLCQASLNETIRNFQLSPNLSILELPLAAITKRDWLSNASKQQTNHLVKRLNQIEHKIKTSYVSKNTFGENKANEPINDGKNIVTIRDTRPNQFLLVTQLIHQLSQSTIYNSMQLRGFKTQRNIESQLKRNPTILSRIQQTYRKLIPVSHRPQWIFLFLSSFHVSIFRIES